MSSTGSARDVYLGCHAELGGLGGAAVQAHELAGACQDAGWHPLLLGFGNRGARLPELPGGIRRENVDVSPRRGLWRVHNWCIPHLLARCLRRLSRPRLAFISFSPFWTVAAKRVWPDVPVITRFCGILSNCTRLARPAGQPLGFWQRVGDAATRVAERQAFRLADRVLVPAPEHADEITTFAPDTGGRIVECREGCARPVLVPGTRARQRREFGFDDDAFVIVAVGSCDRNKAFDHAIRELRDIDPRGRLVIVGDGPEREALGQLARELGVEGRVAVVGRQPDVGAWYAAADCILSTSLYDTFPNTIKEALWCDRPVVVPRHDPPHVYAGISGLVQRQRLGFTYHRHRAGALAACLNGIIARRATVAVRAAEAGTKARRIFVWDDTLEQIRDIAGTGSGAQGARTAPDGEVESLDVETAENVACSSERVGLRSIPKATHGCRHE